ncbi:hypothetical protein E2C01_025742 [Portunus trituberculatus]|uniref:Uncharacterized protein n=1 Tax=Portunus trituberculatus TaxID=210409 RepID=A0A5B7EE27_PORTR|nr:hypothetical protein [Portunus trituberculatus]
MELRMVTKEAVQHSGICLFSVNIKHFTNKQHTKIFEPQPLPSTQEVHPTTPWYTLTHPNTPTTNTTPTNSTKQTSNNETLT